jgi:isoleucyl-tRNA synthetase
VLTTDAAPDDAFTLEDVTDVAVVPGGADGAKCERCWKILPEVEAAADPVCGRCADAVSVHVVAAS